MQNIYALINENKCSKVKNVTCILFFLIFPFKKPHDHADYHFIKETSSLFKAIDSSCVPNSFLKVGLDLQY